MSGPTRRPRPTSRKRPTRRNDTRDPSLTGPQRLARAVPGTEYEPSTLRGPYGDPAPLVLPETPDLAGLYLVAPSCKDRAAGHEPGAGFWICLTHSQRFDNQFQKDTHIHEGAHVLAWYCAVCQEVQVP